MSTSNDLFLKTQVEVARYVAMGGLPDGVHVIVHADGRPQDITARVRYFVDAASQEEQ